MTRALLFMALLWAGCERRVPTPTVEEIRTVDGPDQETWSPELFLSEEGRPRVHLRGAYMAYYDRPDSSYMVLSGLEPGDRVRVDIFDAVGDSAAVVLADQVTFYDRERRMIARGNVIAEAREQRRIESEQLRWSEFERSITTPGFARIYMPDRELEGYGLVADEDITNVRLSNVTGIVMIEEDEL